jgi:serine/threonine protein kinase
MAEPNGSPSGALPNPASAARDDLTVLASGQAAPSGREDSRIVAALRHYAALVEKQAAPARAEFLAQYPAIAEPLAAALDGMILLDHVAGGMKRLPASRPATETFEPTLPLGDFRIIRELGRGGMGIVYEAEQLSLGRRVALKVLPFAAALDAKQLARFKNEAHAAAHLHHTNIVPVFAVGCDRGVHYYAMQFIEGQTLADFIRGRRQQAQLAAPDDHESAPRPAGDASRPLAGPSPGQRAASDVVLLGQDVSTTLPHVQRNGKPATRGSAAPQAGGGASTRVAANHSTKTTGRGLEHFKSLARLALQAADALEYAHSMGVVHRDIKPANMLVDSRGVLWVTDFGLAHFRRAGELTVSGDLLGTARYMSPEQTRGERARVDHHTDIYSLGVTLYELFTLQHAFDGKGWNELMRQIAHEEPAPPRKQCPDLPVEIDIIIQKAMAKNPLDRYATAGALAEDLRRFLEDRPILARRPTLLQVASKWARRHRAVLATAAAALILAFAALSWFYWRLYQESQATLEQEGRRVKWGNTARQAVDTMYTEFAEKWLKDHPQLQAVQREFLQRARDFYAEFAQERGNEPAVRHRRALAALRVGDIERMFCRHRKSEATYGAAFAAYEDAIGGLERLAAEFPQHAVYPLDLARALNGCGLLHLEFGELSAGERRLSEAVRINRRHLGAASAGEQYRPRLDLATHQGNLGHAQLKLRQYRPACENMQASLALFEELKQDWIDGDRQPTDGQESGVPVLNGDSRRRESRLSLEPEMARIHLLLGMLYHETGKLPQANSHWRQSLELTQKLAEDFPYEFKFKSILAQSYKQIGGRCYEEGQFREADASLHRALALHEQLTSALDLPDQLRELAACRALLGRVARERGRFQEAAQHYRAEVEIWTRLVEAGAAERKFLAISKNSLGHVLLDLQKPREAEAVFREVLDLEMEHFSRFSSPVVDRHRMAIYHNNRAKALWRLGRLEEAEQHFREAVALSGDVFRDGCPDQDCKPAEYRDAAAKLHANFAQFLVQQGNLLEAERQLQCARGQEYKLHWECAQTPKWYAQLAQTYLRLAALYEKQRQPGLAGQYYEHAAATLLRLLSDLPEHPEALNHAAWFLATCPDPRFRDFAQALRLSERAMSTERAMDSVLPNALRTQGFICLRQGDRCRAIALLEDAVARRDRPDALTYILLALAHVGNGDYPRGILYHILALAEYRRSGSIDEELQPYLAEFAAALSARRTIRPPSK